MSKTDQMSIRFDTAAQLVEVKKAAKLKKWSANRFVVEAAIEAAKLLLRSESTKEVTA